MERFPNYLYASNYTELGVMRSNIVKLINEPKSEGFPYQYDGNHYDSMEDEDLGCDSDREKWKIERGNFDIICKELNDRDFVCEVIKITNNDGYRSSTDYYYFALIINLPETDED